MITLKDLSPIGFVSKTHGIKGELNVSLNDVFNPEDFRFLIFDIDSTFIPFRIESSRGKGEANRLVRLEGVSTVEDAQPFVGSTVYVLTTELERHPDYDASDSEGYYLSDFVGFTLRDEEGRYIGLVTGFNDDTENYLLEVETPSAKSVLIPFVTEWIEEIDGDNKEIRINLPVGLIEE